MCNVAGNFYVIFHIAVGQCLHGTAAHIDGYAFDICNHFETPLQLGGLFFIESIYQIDERFGAKHGLIVSE